MPDEQQAQFDYVVVGSGAGGGPVAANLASAGFKVLLIEAGYEYRDLNYDVPGFHGQATQDPEMAWDFFVKHYSAAERNTDQYDSKYVNGKGVLYPRAGTLGGCTGHHAMITVYPHDSDWEGISAIARADDSADDSWDPRRMRRIFQRIERCGYIPRQPAPQGGDPHHGYDGWLSTDVITDLVDPETVLADPDFQLIQTVVGAFHATSLDLDFDPSDPRTLDRVLDKVEEVLEGAPKLKEIFGLRSLIGKKKELEAHIKGAINRFLDPNVYPVSDDLREGVFLIPLAVSPDRRARVGSRDRINQVRGQFPQNLTVWCNTFVTRLVIEGMRAVGVEYVKGPKYYDASRPPLDHRDRLAPREVIRVRREVIVAGGSFNTPQLLMLSGIGPKDHLAEHDIKGEHFTCDRPAVGRFLQDRYEVGFISEFPRNFSILGNALFRKPKPGETDAVLDQWKEQHDGLYATNGAVISVIRRSSPGLPDPDLFLFGLPASFHGYYPGYADRIEAHRDRFTWAILKAHTKNKGGYVRLASGDPYDRPEINFKYFDEGTDEGGDDLNAMVQGINFVRKFTAHLGVEARPLVSTKKDPPDLDDRNQVAEWVKQEAWGHHACGTCRIGPRDDLKDSVLDTNFRVKGVQGLRVVDASVFPSIPGFFIVTPIYMIAEKASESILQDAGWKPDGAAGDGLNLPKIG